VKGALAFKAAAPRAACQLAMGTAHASYNVWNAAAEEGAEGCAPIQSDRRWSELKYKAAV
jgi:hypothetical protein